MLVKGLEQINLSILAAEASRLGALLAPGPQVTSVEHAHCGPHSRLAIRAPRPRSSTDLFIQGP